MRIRVVLLATIALLAISAPLCAGVGPIIDTFVVTPPVPAPGQAVTISVTARDPDCLTSCTTGCGLTIRNDLVFWSDNTARTPSPFQNQQSSATASPFTTQVTWIAPPVSGTYNVTLQLNDSGGMLCGGRKTTTATYPITVTNSQPPVIDAFTATTSSLQVGGSCDLTVVARDPGGLPLTYSFTADAGTISQATPPAPTARWTAPQSAGNVTIRVKVSNGAVDVSSQVMVNVQLGAYMRTLAIADSRATRVAPFIDGRVAIVDGANNVLQVISSTGVSSWRATGLSMPTSVALQDGQLFVLERGARKISVWTTGGARLREIPIAAVAPNDIAFGPASGELTVSDTGSAQVLVISAADGRTLRTLGGGTLQQPAGVATSNGRVAVADVALGKVFVFDANGNPVNAVGDSTTLVRPQGLAWDVPGARFIVTDSFSGEIFVIGEEGSIRGSLSGFGTAAGQLINPIDVALLADGSIAVTTAGGDIAIFQLFASLAPVAPATNVAASDRADDDGGVIEVSWTASTDDPARVTSYLVERSVGETGAFTSITNVGKGTVTYRDTTVADANCYHYRIVASDGVNQTPSAATPCVSSRNNVPPPAPATVTAVAASPTQVVVSWSAVIVGDLAGYVVDVGSTSLRTGVTTEATISNLTGATEYQVSVRAVDTGANTSVPLITTVRTPASTPPPAPTAVTVTDRSTGGAVDVTWLQAEGESDAAKWTVTLTPRERGWPAVVATTTTTRATIDGLVNGLAYDATVVMQARWGAKSDPSLPARGTPSAPERKLPILGETAEEDVAGLDIAVTIDRSSREVRFQYTSDGATLQAYLDDRPIGTPLGSTGGTWTDAAIVLQLDAVAASASHQLALRNVNFPDATAKLGLRRIDFVPLPPADVRVEPLNTILDVRWTPQEARSDLVPVLTRIARGGAQREVACGAELLALCRDTFVPNGEEMMYRLAIASPAGWVSDAVDANGVSKYDGAPPPVTDARIAQDGTRLRIDWTPVSTAASEGATPVPVVSYRIYRMEGDAFVLVGDTPAPPFAIGSEFAFVVRAVDAEGRESR